MLTVQTMTLPGLRLIEQDADPARGGVASHTGYHPTQYAAFGITGGFASDRFLHGVQASLRGLYVVPDEQAMLLTPVQGELFIAVADVRPKSRRFGCVEIIELSHTSPRQIYIGAGLAFGVCTMSESAIWHERYTGFFDPAQADGVFWRDADLNIPWPVQFPLLSDRDASHPALEKLVEKARVKLPA